MSEGVMKHSLGCSVQPESIFTSYKGCMWMTLGNKWRSNHTKFTYFVTANLCMLAVSSLIYVWKQNNFSVACKQVPYKWGMGQKQSETKTSIFSPTPAFSHLPTWPHSAHSGKLPDYLCSIPQPCLRPLFRNDSSIHGLKFDYNFICRLRTSVKTTTRSMN